MVVEGPVLHKCFLSYGQLCMVPGNPVLFPTGGKMLNNAKMAATVSWRAGAATTDSLGKGNICSLIPCQASAVEIGICGSAPTTCMENQGGLCWVFQVPRRHRFFPIGGNNGKSAAVPTSFLGPILFGPPPSSQFHSPLPYKVSPLTRRPLTPHHYWLCSGIFSNTQSWICECTIGTINRVGPLMASMKAATVMLKQHLGRNIVYFCSSE